MSLLCSTLDLEGTGLAGVALHIRERINAPTAGFLRSSPDHDLPLSSQSPREASNPLISNPQLLIVKETC